MANALPAAAGFDDPAARRAWLAQHEGKPLAAAATDLANRRMKAAFQTKRTAVQKRDDAAAARRKQEAIWRWLKAPPDAEQPAGVTPVDVAKVVAKEELKEYLNTQLVPLVTEFAAHTLKENWLKLLALLLGSVVVWRGANYTVKGGTGWLWSLASKYARR
jgi:hypothetical protein